jgi:hypothetical protein
MTISRHGVSSCCTSFGGLLLSAAHLHAQTARIAGRLAMLFVRTDCQGTEARLPVTVTIQTRMR